MSEPFTLSMGDESTLDSIAPLWEKLNQLHLERSVHFRQYYRRFTFAARKESLLARAREGDLRVLLARHGDVPVGYCVASLTEGVGEIDSLYLEAQCRGKGVGHSLMEAALDWLRAAGARKILVEVSVGNEEAFPFYARYGLFPRLTQLQLLPE